MNLMKVDYPLTADAIHYAWRQLLVRAGMDDETAPVTLCYGEVSTPNSPRVVVRPCAPQAWGELLSRPPGTLRWIPVEETIPVGARLPFKDPVPVLFWGKERDESDVPFAKMDSNLNVVFNADIIAATVFMLSRWEEMVVPVCDEHDRFPASASVAYKQSFLDRPVVDEYAMILRAWLLALFPCWQPARRKFSVKVTYDVDHVFPFQSMQNAMRACVGDILKRRRPAQAWDNLKDAFWQSLVPERNSYLQAVYALAALSTRNGLDSAFYFMSAKPSLFDSGYDPELPWVKACIQELLKQGVEIGFHPGYYTLDDPGLFAVEKQRLDDVVGHTKYGGRQHFLRFRVPDTWLLWESAGLTYDSTMVYPDHEGFRCGTCHPFQPYDLRTDRLLDLWEQPPIVMDGTLRDYRSLTPAAGEHRILELARRCRDVEGTFILIWHNTSLSKGWVEWGAMYQRVIEKLTIGLFPN